MTPEKYMSLAREISTWSKDPSTKVGAIAVGKHGQILSQGFNGFPRKVLEPNYRWNQRETKLRFVVHAEMNTIFNASLTGVSLEGSTLYVYPLYVCHECAKGIIQAGIKEVYVVEQEVPELWKDSCRLAEVMFREASVKYNKIKFD